MAKKSDVKKTKWSKSQLESHIRKESQNSFNVVFTDHIKTQMKKRNITLPMVMNTLQKGKINRTPEPNTMKGSLECRMEHFVAGCNVAVVVAVLDEDPSLILVTSMYI